MHIHMNTSFEFGVVFIKRKRIQYGHRLKLALCLLYAPRRVCISVEVGVVFVERYGSRVRSTVQQYAVLELSRSAQRATWYDIQHRMRRVVAALIQLSTPLPFPAVSNRFSC